MNRHPTHMLLDELAGLAAGADAGPRLPLLRSVVADLEDLAGAPLGDLEVDPAVVLQRRLARAHGLLLAGRHAALASRLQPLVEKLRTHDRADGHESAVPATRNFRWRGGRRSAELDVRPSPC